MDLADFSLETFILSLGIALFLHVIFIRKLIFSFLDPWLLLFFNQVMILSVVIYAFLTSNILNQHFIYLIACWFSFVLGLYLFKNDLIVNGYTGKTILTKFVTHFSLKIYFFIFCINGIVIFSLMGIPLFSGQSRTISDYSNMGTGFGLLFYLNWGLQEIIKLLSLKIWLIDKKRNLGLTVLIILCLFNIFNGGSRAVYLDLILYFGLGMFYFKRFKNMTILTPSIIKFSFFLLPFIILFSFISAVNTGYESNVFFALIKRTVGTAEGPFYYFIKNSYAGFSGLNLISYHLSGFLPYFGYIDKNALDLGVNLTAFSDLKFGTAGYGPNPTIYVIGHIAFGSFGFIYCFIIGSLLSFLRYRFKSSFFVWMLFNYLATTLISDGTLMPLSIFYILLISPIFLFSLVLKEILTNSINLSLK